LELKHAESRAMASLRCPKKNRESWLSCLADQPVLIQLAKDESKKLYKLTQYLTQVRPKVSPVTCLTPSWVRNQPRFSSRSSPGALPQFSQVFSRWGQAAISCTVAWKKPLKSFENTLQVCWDVL
jgi:hypothetical protein